METLHASLENRRTLLIPTLLLHAMGGITMLIYVGQI